MLRRDLSLIVSRITASLPSPFKGEGVFFRLRTPSPSPLEGEGREGGPAFRFFLDLSKS
jgi:hypothetical protein